jgi:hypothetical protein
MKTEHRHGDHKGITNLFLYYIEDLLWRDPSSHPSISGYEIKIAGLLPPLLHTLRDVMVKNRKELDPLLRNQISGHFPHTTAVVLLLPRLI